MAARLTDKQKKKIVADYVELGSYRATGKRNKVSTDTVKRIVLNDPTFVQKTKQKKEENTLEMLAYMDSKKGKAQEVIDLCLAALSDPDRLERATLAQIGTVLGIVIDKFTKGAEIPATADDGFVEALNSTAGEVWPDGDTGDIPV